MPRGRVPRRFLSGSVPTASGGQVDALGNILEHTPSRGVGMVVLLLEVARERRRLVELRVD